MDSVTPNPIRVNEAIQAAVVRVIGEHKENLGRIELSQAIKLAQSRGLDLIEIAPNANPPICRIVGYSKARYKPRTAQEQGFAA
jgi:translation initiation factor IF-3